MAEKEKIEIHRSPKGIYFERSATSDIDGKGEAVTAAMQPYARFGVNVNVDFYAGVIYYLSGIPQDLFVPIFAAGRVPGWVAQCLEQQRGNILIRPLTEYNGPQPRPYQSIVSR